jgi:hypothetical protein
MLPYAAPATSSQIYHSRVESANRRALRVHAPRPWSGKIHLFITAGGIRALEHRPAWEDLALGGVERVPIAGSHETFMEPEPVRQWAPRFQQALDAAQDAILGNRIAKDLTQAFPHQGD